MNQRAISENVPDILGRLEDAINDAKIESDIVGKYKKTRGIIGDMIFPTYYVDDVAESYIKALDFTRFAVTHSRDKKLIRVLESLGPLRALEGFIRGYLNKDETFKVFWRTRLTRMIDDVDNIITTFTNWVSDQTQSSTNFSFGGVDTSELEHIWEDSEGEFQK